MKVLVISQYFWPEAFRINDLVQALKGKGVEVCVLTGHPNYPRGKFFSGHNAFTPWRENFVGADIVRVPLWPRRKGGAVNLALNYVSFILSSIVLGLPRVGRGFDAVFVFAPSPILQCLTALAYKFLFRKPVVLWVQDLWPESLVAVGMIRSKLVLKFVESVVRFIYRHCDLILVQSKAFVPNVARLNPHGTPVDYLPNWAEELYSVDDVPSAPPVALPKGFCVLFAGNIGRAQAITTILDAAKKLRSVDGIHWVFLGDGTERASAEAIVAAKGLGGQVHFLGSFPVTDMPAFFAKADALLVTLSRHEIFASVVPSKVQSYLASGRPIIASMDGEGARVIEEAGAGFCGPAEDASALAANVLAMYELTEEERRELGRRARDHYLTNFSRERLIDQLQAKLVEVSLKESAL